MEIISTQHYSLKQIFQEHWEDFLFENQASVPEYANLIVNKMLSCRDPDKLGYHKFSCPDHPDCYTVIPHSCKSRFCTSCGKVLTDQWVVKAEASFPQTPFHHLCWTIPDSLRDLIDNNRFLLNSLFTAAAQTMLSFAKEKHLLPAIICVLHTFGRNLKFHPHIQMLFSAGGISLKNKRFNKWKYCRFIPFKMLHKRWRFLLIATLKKEIRKYLKKNPDCPKLSIFSYPTLLDTFFNPLLSLNWYVYHSKELSSENFTISYIGRYTKKPPLAESRILNYFKKQGTFWVTFSYKERNQPTVNWTIKVYKFIKLLIQHILPPNFRQVRYYGALSNRVKPCYQKIISKLTQKAKQISTLTTWRERQIAFRGKDPLHCPVCGKLMRLTEAAFFSKKSNSLSYYHPP